MRQRKRTAGFSLVEMIVVMAIIVILSGMTLAYNRSSGQKIALFTDQAKVIGVLNRAKTFALEKYKEGNSSYCAFGVAFGPGTSYSIVGVVAPASGACPLSGPYASIETYALDKGVSFGSVPSSNPVLFEAPYLTTVNFGTVTLQMAGTTPPTQANVEVTQGGSISAVQ